MTVPGNFRTDILLFSETGGFILEVSKQNINKVEHIFEKYSSEYFKVGKTASTKNIEINKIINISAETARHAWENGLRDKLL